MQTRVCQLPVLAADAQATSHLSHLSRCTPLNVACRALWGQFIAHEVRRRVLKTLSHLCLADKTP